MMNSKPPKAIKRSLVATAIMTVTIASPYELISALSLDRLSRRQRPHHAHLVGLRRRLIGPKIGVECNAKSVRVHVDLDQVLSNEKDFFTSSDDHDLALTSGEKKNKIKERMRKQRQKIQQRKKKNRDSNKLIGVNKKLLQNNGDFDDETMDIISRTDDCANSFLQSISFSAYEIHTSLEGTRIDAALVELLNKESQTTSLSISRTQCGTLLSNGYVFLVPPENAHIFKHALSAHNILQGQSTTTTNIPHVLIEQYCMPIHRKSHIMESQSIIVYPTYDSPFPDTTSSMMSTLLSNLIPPTEIIAQNIPLDILYEDDHMVVINKQAGIVVHPAAGNWDGTIVNALAYYLMNESPHDMGDLFTNPALKSVDSCHEVIANNDIDANQNDAVTNSLSTLRPGIVHRLDKGTSGVLIVAKTTSALASLSEAFANRKVKKQYLAVTIGNPGADQWINKPIGRHPLHRQKMRVVPNPSTLMSSRLQARLADDNGTSIAKRGRPAQSHIHTIHHDGKLSVVQVEIATGRTHQIRVHLQDHGTPIYGDDVYGLSDWNKVLSTQRGITRPLLHAHKIQIEHPVTGENMVFEARVADDMMEVITAIWPFGQEIVF